MCCVMKRFLFYLAYILNMVLKNENGTFFGAVRFTLFNFFLNLDIFGTVFDPELICIANKKKTVRYLSV